MATLYMVATPIGNLNDFSDRAKDTLKKCEVIFCEDTRVTDKLCNTFGIKGKKISCNHHNEAMRAKELLGILSKGTDVAYVSDAGTPGISDPGAKLVNAAKDAGFSVSPVPGASALTAIISVAGIESSAFKFLGFLPSKKTAREEEIKKQSEDIPWVFYEAPHRIHDTFCDIFLWLPENFKIIIGRELTKKFEQIWSGTIQELKDDLEKIPAKGEFVLVVIPVIKNKETPEITDKQHILLQELLSKFSVKESVRIFCDHTDLPKNKIYDLAVQIKNKK